MAKFKVMVGQHTDAKTKRVFSIGDVVESDSDLVTIFKGKFEKAEKDAEVSKGEPINGLGNTKPMDPNKPEAEKADGFKAIRNGQNNWDVLGLDGKPINSDPLTKKAALTLEKKMNAGRDA